MSQQATGGASAPPESVKANPRRDAAAAFSPPRWARFLLRPYQGDTTWLWSILHVPARILTTLMFDLKVTGAHHVPRTGGVLLVCNHQSYLDPILIGVQIRRSVSYLAKSELFASAAFNLLIRGLNAFPVRQGEGDVGAVKEAIARLKEGRALTIFPEGGRSRDGRLRPIQPGVALIVRRAGVPIVPVVLDGAYKAWAKGTTLFRPHPIHIMYGEPMDVKDMRPAEIVALIQRTLERMLREMRAAEDR